jgi:hypothetical protein
LQPADDSPPNPTTAPSGRRTESPSDPGLGREPYAGLHHLRIEHCQLIPSSPERFIDDVASVFADLARFEIAGCVALDGTTPVLVGPSDIATVEVPASPLLVARVIAAEVGKPARALDDANNDDNVRTPWVSPTQEWIRGGAGGIRSTVRRSALCL